MDIFYTKKTLFVNFDDSVTIENVRMLENRVFRILDNYDIDNIVVKILSSDYFDNQMFDDFINNYKMNYNGNLRID